MKKVLKFVGIALLSLFALGFIASMFGSKDNTSSSSSSGGSTASNAKAAEKKWVEVYTFKGSGAKKSAPFKLSGNNARIRYKYSGPEMGKIFSFYVVDQGKDIMKEGGFPEVMITEDEESETYVQKDNGEYYLNVNAQGKWDLVVEEQM